MSKVIVRELENYCAEYIDLFRILTNNEKATYINFYLNWQEHATKNLDLLLNPQSGLVDLPETLDDFMKSLNLHEKLDLRWPFIIDGYLIKKIAKSEAIETQINILRELFFIASGDFSNTKLISTGPCVFRFSLLKTIGAKFHLLFSIYPTYNNKKNTLHQYIRFDTVFEKMPTDFSDIIIQSNKSLREIESIDKRLLDIFDPYQWANKFGQLPRRSLEGMTEKDEAGYFLPMLNSLPFSCEIEAPSNVMKSVVPYNERLILAKKNKELMDKVMRKQTIYEWGNHWKEMERTRQIQYMKILTPEEEEVVAECRNIITIGRSGTGKTLCGLLRILASEELFNNRLKTKAANVDNDDIHHMIDFRYTKNSANNNCKMHTIFMTSSSLLADEVKKRFNQGVDIKNGLERNLRSLKEEVKEGKVEEPENTIKEDEELPESMNLIQEKHFPLFITARQLLTLIDSTLDKPFFNASRKKITPVMAKISAWELKENNSLSSAPNKLDTEGFENVNIDDITQELLDEMENDNPELVEEKKVEIKTVQKGVSYVLTKKEHEEQGIPCGIEIEYTNFVTLYWNPSFGKKVKYHISANTVWKEIYTYIKGSVKSYLSPTHYLSKKEYFQITKSSTLFSEEEQEEIYNIFLKYQQWLNDTQNYDMLDLLNHILEFLKWGYRGVPLHEIICDEVQDLPPAYFLLLAILAEEKLLFAGDTAQAIAEGVGFRFQDLRAMFHDFFMPIEPPIIMELTQNFRSHGRILDLATSVIRLLELFFPTSIDKLRKEKSALDGLKPILVDTEALLYGMFMGSDNEQLRAPIEFGFNQAILVRTTEAKEKLPDFLKGALCFTIHEAKGLEFDDVILYNFFEDSSVELTHWKLLRLVNVENFNIPLNLTDRDLGNRLDQLEIKDQKLMQESCTLLPSQCRVVQHVSLEKQILQIDVKYRGLCAELKQLYTAITRARNKVLIYDNKGCANKAFIAEYWKKLDYVIEYSSSVSVLTNTSLVFNKLTLQ